MQIVFVDGPDRTELDVRVNHPSATVADLAAALAPWEGGERSLVIGDRVADPDLALAEAGLHEGAVVRVATGAAPPGPDGREAGGRELVVTGGLDAGRRFPLRPGMTVIGRGVGCEATLEDGTLSRRHAAVTLGPTGAVEVADLGSHNGTWRDDRQVTAPEPMPDGAPVRLGGHEVEVRPARVDDRPQATDPRSHVTAAGTMPFNRPPRPAAAVGPDELPRPSPPPEGPASVPFSPLGLVAPLVLAGALYLVMRSPQVLMFAALTPVMGLVNVVDARRRGRRTDRRERARFARELAELRTGLAAAAGRERSRRLAASPDPAEVVRRATLPTASLWERRPAHDDFLVLRAGVGDVRWTPPVAAPGSAVVSPELEEVVAAASDLPGAPVPVSLAGGGVVGIVGDRRAALGLARSLLCQAATLHGPADLPVMVLTAPGAAADWDWAKWLPHAHDPLGPGRLLSPDPDTSAALAEARLRPWRSGGTSADGPTLLVVVDDESLTGGRRSPARALLRGDAGPAAGIVVASAVDRLPAVCTAIVDVTDPDGAADLTLPGQGERIGGFLLAGMADDVARDCARALARFEDPELDVPGAGLPRDVRLLPLLDMDPTPEAVLARWETAGPDPRPVVPLGVADDGVVSVDLVADGPHALVGGTTGAGKSELLRTIVAGLAAGVDPDHLTFVLIDFKGGSAFDECARLPHTVGMVTDLDEHLAERALRCLEAELRHRERLLRATGAVDLPDYRRRSAATGSGEAVPRLLVVIDEFATLKAELPGFIDALVGVAQRGRSLGVHLLLATQRPQGAVSDNIRANTNLRIALRMQDAADSRDVIELPDAAAIPRDAPGRAYMRLGPGEVVAMQTALSTGARTGPAPAPVDVAPFVFGPEPRAPEAAQQGPDPGTTDGTPGGDDSPGAAAEAPPAGDVAAETELAALVTAISDAFARTGRPRPRRPWPEPLPGEVDLDAVIDADLAAGGGAAFTPLGLADDPEAQAQYPMGWDRRDGNLIVYGIGGSGTTTTLASLAFALARTCSADDVHVYGLDFGAGELAALAPLPHVGAVLLAGERERQARLIRHLRAELDRRRDLGPATARAEPEIVTLVDGWSAFAAEYADLAGTALWEAFVRVFADGPEVGLYTVVAADRRSAVPGALASLVRQRLALRLADRADYGAFGVRPAALPRMVPGRALVGGTCQVVQIARPSAGLTAAVERLVRAWATTATTGVVAPARRAPAPIDTLAPRVPLRDLGAGAELGARPWRIPIGLAERMRSPAVLVAYQGEHVLVAGPARSGRSTALLTIAAACRAAQPGLRVVAVAGARSPLAADPLVDEVVPPARVGARLGALIEPIDPAGEAGAVAAADHRAATLVLVDDADLVEDAGGVLERLATADRPDLLLVAAGRNDGVRTGYSHWTRALRRSKVGLLLRPDVDLDGDILGATIPRRSPVAMTTGRGYLAAGGDVELVQVAVPE